MKRILVHLDASPRAAARLALAQGLAQQHGAEVTVLYGVLPAMLASPWAAGEAMAVAASWFAELDQEQLARARATFDNAARQGALTWVDAGVAPYRSLVQHALHADLLVLAQQDADDVQTGALPPDLLPGAITDSGKPTLVVPHSGSFAASAARVLVAWKPTREAARAITAALPWLRQASAIDVALAAPDPDNGADVDHRAALLHWLRCQGVAATPQLHQIGPGDVGEQLLRLAADARAELLVMGCYGHSRASEWVLGGASRAILRSMTLPVLMVH